jgi:hypothetical protein
MLAVLRNVKECYKDIPAQMNRLVYQWNRLCTLALISSSYSMAINLSYGTGVSIINSRCMTVLSFELPTKKTISLETKKEYVPL